MRLGLIVFAMVMLSGCAGYIIGYGLAPKPPSTDDVGLPKIGMTKEAVDKYFEDQSAPSVKWMNSPVSVEKLDLDLNKEVIEYAWTYNEYIVPYVKKWHVTFIDNKVVKYELLDQQTQTSRSSGSSGGMNILCKDAIARGDRSAMTVHC